jgi:hypothetical protein
VAAELVGEPQAQPARAGIGDGQETPGWGTSLATRIREAPSVRCAVKRARLDLITLAGRSDLSSRKVIPPVLPMAARTSPVVDAPRATRQGSPIAAPSCRKGTTTPRNSSSES